MLLTILMPCLNEEKTVGQCVKIAMETIRSLGITGEVLVADNGSRDKSVMLAEAAGARAIHVPEKGYGTALRGGIMSAKGEFTIMADCDLSYDFGQTNIGSFLHELQNGSDFVMGNRFKGGIAKRAMPFLHKLATPCMALVLNILYRTRIGDIHCGMRGFNTEKMRSLLFISTGMEFASEMIIRAKHASYIITEIPTPLALDGRGHAPHMRSFRDGWRHVCIWGRLFIKK